MNPVQSIILANLLFVLLRVISRYRVVRNHQRVLLLRRQALLQRAKRTLEECERLTRKKRFKRRKKRASPIADCEWYAILTRLKEAAAECAKYDDSDVSKAAETARRWFVLAHQDWR